MKSQLDKNIVTAVIVAALGYFVDIYDLIIFSIVRKSSLANLGLNEEDILNKGLLIINTQMLGMLLGGIVWGILGDKKGRKNILYASIIIYSLANIGNAFVNSVEAYMFWRFIGGFGLAGELGIGITLVVELMPINKRGYGTSIVAGFGILGGLAAYYLSQLFDWRSCYIIGGVLGFILLLLRININDSVIYKQVQQNQHIQKGNFLKLFSKKHWLTYLKCIGIGIPIWFIVGILITFSDKFAKLLNVKEMISPAKAVMLCYLGLSVGDFLSGLLSQYLKSRIKTVYVFLLLSVVFLSLFFNAKEVTAFYFYIITFFLGLSAGYWAIFVTIGAESFPTNLRATAATTIPNFVRGSLTLVSFLFTALQSSFTFINSAIITASVCMCIAFISNIFSKDTFIKDLDYYH